jgi:predicted lipid-binding transport protein (Tim44 family)
MKTFLTALLAVVGLSVAAMDADAARRLGGGKNLGMQRSAPAQQKAAPAQQQQQQAAPAQQPQPTGASKWLGPLAGLALGAGLAALFFNNGMGGLLAGMLVIGLILAVVFFVGRALLGRSRERPVQYAGFPGSVSAPVPAPLPGGAGGSSVAATTGTTTAAPLTGFDEAEFLRHAKLNFTRLQEAHDRKDISALREYLAPEVYRQVEADIQASWGAPQKTEIVALDARVLDVAEEASSYVVSVRFTGSLREAGEHDAEPLDEIWHLEKPVKGRGGWIVAGIQQS